MSEKKDINKLFQEKFENFEVTPDEMVWEHIEMKLKEKKKKRVIPFWWKLSGIAAALLVGFLVYDNFKISNPTENGIVNQGNNKIKPSDASVNKTSGINSSVATTNNASNNSKVTNNGTENKNRTSEISTTNTKENNASIGSEKTILKYNSNKNNSIANSDSESIPNKSEKQIRKNPAVIQNNSEEKVAFHRTKQKKDNQRKSVVPIENNSYLAIKSEPKDENSNAVINSKKESNNSIANTTVTKNKSVLNSNIETEQTANKKIDSTKIASVEPNALEELLKEKENKSITEPKLNRWQVSSNVAPIYFSSISNGSPLDSSLKNNDKSYAANNQSYGIGVNYTLNKRVKLRTGVNVLNVDYNTNGIVYYQTQSTSGKLANLNPNLMGSSIVIENLSNVDAPFNKMIEKSEGSLNQKLGYIEMPLEVTYKVLDKKFGIDVIGGMSTMILNRNEIYLQSSELNVKIGEANNLNNIHFSGNVGIGFKYDIFRRLEARIEPVFKYQINTFNNDAGNFKPYVFGVYSGINFSF